MNIRKGDNVIMLTGKDRGKDGKVLGVLDDRVVIEGLNMIKRHQRARKQGQKGQIITKERSVDVSNVQVICPKCGKPTRIGHQMIGNADASAGGKKIRICKKCNNEI